MLSKALFKVKEYDNYERYLLDTIGYIASIGSYAVDDMGLRRQDFTMSGRRWLLLLATITTLSFETFTEVWKASNSVWYCNFDFGDEPPWWFLVESLSTISGLICFYAIAYILGVAIFDGIMFIVRKINR